MTPAEVLSSDLAEAAQALRAKDEPFAFATIVRTAGSTAAKPGAKALLGADGTILRGWLGGGCTRGAVKQATLRALEEGRPQLVSVTPEDMLEQMGVAPGEEVAGTRFARNGCPSRGTVDIFIEPCIPMPQLLVLGASPVAQALCELAPRFQWTVASAPPAASEGNQPPIKCVVVATQGQGDLDALKAALSQPSGYIAFVGSARKFVSLSEKLIAAGCDADAVARVKAPAGLDIGAVTPEEIALSILAELVQTRRSAVVADHD
ncbi:XdhC family protein [Yoonia sp. I 8.24]|uniref:XdhC family protein n=1 Tax=Yoonia sp. I 8.24 TaxID=1537229 RepID=UPI001EDCD9FA|nr:XdhC family protein [Yoonia sp. I 8.24]MCG3267840.1 XdhC family protein [Yoonia sp. I 8.24]